MNDIMIRLKSRLGFLKSETGTKAAKEVIYLQPKVYSVILLIHASLQGKVLIVSYKYFLNTVSITKFIVISRMRKQYHVETLFLNDTV